jgi:hypothetical protein
MAHRCAHNLWMQLAIEKNEALNPAPVSLLDTNTEVFYSDYVANLLMQFGGLVRHGTGPICSFDDRPDMTRTNIKIKYLWSGPLHIPQIWGFVLPHI